MTAPTAELASIVYGDRGVPLDDPAELYHESSRLYPDVAPGRIGAIAELGRNCELRQTVARASRTFDHLPGIDLPDGPLGRARLREVLADRRSRLERGGLGRVDLAALLQAAYRSVGAHRPSPSGGALYPLELYVAATNVDDVASAVYHYHPFRHRLERIAPLRREQVAASLVDPELADRTAALLVVTAMFWRSRFKYGARGYRFALLEAGHVVQNVLLAATATRITALPLGGFFDCRVDELVGADGLEESSVHAVLLGGRG